MSVHLRFKMKRIAIYNFYNRNGIVGDYVKYFLKSMSEFCEYICVVVNGTVNSNGRKILEENCNALFIRENAGYDSWAHKYAIEQIGYREIAQYDELIFCNSTFYGPVFPLSTLFGEMESRNADFWGISRYPYNEMKDALDPNKLFKIPSHIQSYFVAFRKQVLQSKAFIEFWDSLRPVHNYDEARGNYEWIMTSFFENRGFSSSVYMDFEKYSKYKENSTILYAAKQLIEDKNPFIKIKVFDYGSDNWLREAIGHDARDVLEYVKNNTDYPIDMIYKDLILNHKMSTLRSELHLEYSLPVDISVNKSETSNKCAVILYAEYEDLAEETIHYLSNFPEYFDIYVISSDQGLLKVYKNGINLPNKVSYLESERRGKEVSAYFISGIDIFKNYDLVCCLHDVKSNLATTVKASDEYSYAYFHNLAASRIFIENIMGLFNANKYLGMLVPPPVDFASFASVGYELCADINTCRELHSKFKLDVPFDDFPVSGYGTMFWARGSVFSLLLKKNFAFSDFSFDQNVNNDNLMQAFARLYPMIAQNAGYYVGWIMTDEYCHNYLDNLFAKSRYYNWFFSKSDAIGWVKQYSYILKKLLNKQPVESKPSKPQIHEINKSKNFQDYLSDSQSKILLKGLFFSLMRYKMLSKITFGKARDRYKRKMETALKLRDVLLEKI